MNRRASERLASALGDGFVVRRSARLVDDEAPHRRDLTGLHPSGAALRRGHRLGGGGPSASTTRSRSWSPSSAGSRPDPGHRRDPEPGHRVGPGRGPGRSGRSAPGSGWLGWPGGGHSGLGALHGHLRSLGARGGLDGQRGRRRGSPVAVGIGVTLLAAICPARQGARSDPVAALRDVAVDGGRVGLFRSVGGLVLLAGGLALGLGRLPRAARAPPTRPGSAPVSCSWRSSCLGRWWPVRSPGCSGRRCAGCGG